MRKPIIGILGNTYKTQPGLFSSAERMYVNSDYIEAVLNNGGIPMAIPAVAMKANPEDVLAVCDGILVPGGEDIVVSATAPDGTIEAIESRNGRIVAVQWHPEGLIHSAPEMNRLFADLVERSSRYREKR